MDFQSQNAWVVNRLGGLNRFFIPRKGDGSFTELYRIAWGRLLRFEKKRDRPAKSNSIVKTNFADQRNKIRAWRVALISNFRAENFLELFIGDVRKKT